MNKKKNSSITKKLISAFLRLLIITIVFSFLATQVSLILLLVKTKSMLIDQAIVSAEAYTEGRAGEINEQLTSIVSKIEESAKYTEYVYQNPSMFHLAPLKTPDEFSGEITENTIHWLPFEKEQTNVPEIREEATLLSAVEPNFKSIMETCPSVISLYIATDTGVNIGYDKNVISKQGIYAYNPITAEANWYNEVLKTHSNYVSDMYEDTFDRGSMITIAVPYYVDDDLRGVIGADIVVENINRDIVEYDGIGRALLFSAEGDPIAGVGVKNTDTALTLLGTEEALAHMKNDEIGTVKSKIGSGEVYIVHTVVPVTGWKFVMILSVSTIVEPASEAGRIVLLVDIAFIAVNILLIWIMCFFANKLAKGLSDPIVSLTEKVTAIGQGNLDYHSEIKTGDEIETLSEGFEDMTVSLKEHIHNLTQITAEKERIGAELDVAAHIQSSILPCIFPPFPDRHEIDVYATMNPAKEVGGDFYDFFMVDERHIAIVMADVSGKGVPAALFMVIGKTLIKDHTQSGKDLGEVFSTVNNLLCQSNSEGLFITAFEGVLDMVTGEFVYVNAGHEMPFISKKGEPFKPYKIKAGFVLAGMEDLHYKAGSIMLEPGDKIFQYTDGVTEATSLDQELFGMERLEAVLATVSDKSPEEILPAVNNGINAFVGEAPQFDDITMLCLEFREKMIEEEESTGL